MGLRKKIRRIINLYKMLWLDDRLDAQMANLKDEIDKLHRRIDLPKLQASKLEIEPPPPRSSPESNARVSIILPVLNNPECTYKCLDSILRNTQHSNYEVIVIDTGSTDGTRDYLSKLRIAGIKVLLNEKNLGFLEGCNACTKVATGDYLVFLDNHAEVQPGWLSALIECAERSHSCGAVGSKLLFTDGTLQEAGGIVFADGTAFQYGREMNPRTPKFNFVREVDYCSSVGLMVRSPLWRDIGGFDHCFAPSGYEDVDLCFEIRRRGFNVLYQPESAIVYAQRGQWDAVLWTENESKLLHRRRFVDKWSSELQRQYENRPEMVAAASDRRSRKSILVVSHFLAFFDRASGFLRLFHIVKLLKQMDYHVTFVAVLSLMEDRYRPVLEDLGVEVHAGDAAARRALAGASGWGPSVDYPVLLGERHYDYAILETWRTAEYYLPKIRKHSPETQIIIDTTDVHFLREMREAELKGTSDLKRVALMNKRREIAVYRQADRLWVVTDDDRAAISDVVKDKPVDIISNMHERVEVKKNFEDRSNLLFVGNFWHQPNVDAIEFFCNDIFPLLDQRLGEAKLYVVGDNIPAEIEALATDRVIILGYVDNLGELMARVRISVAPLRFGAGMKGKIGEALAHGLPVVTTSIGAEGMGLENGRDALIAETPQEFADQIVRLYTDRELWDFLSANGLDKVRGQWSPEAVKPCLKVILERTNAAKPRKDSRSLNIRAAFSALKRG